MKQLFFIFALTATISASSQVVFDVPYSTDFENYTSEAEFQTEWSYENNLPTDQAGVWGFDYTAYFGYNASNCPFYFTASDGISNDWLFTPGFNLVAGTNYDLSFLYAGVDPAYTEKMKVFIGTDDTSTSMNTLIFDFTAITSNVFQNHSSVFSVPSSGVYYFGFLAYSDANNFGILIDNFEMNLQTGFNSLTNNSIGIYPNPCVGEVNIAMNTPFTWSLYSADGQCLTKNQNSSNPKLDLSAFSNGLYFLRINDNSAIPIVLRR